MKKSHKAAIIAGFVLLVVWLSLPESGDPSTIAVAVGARLFLLALVCAFVWFFIWLLGPRVFYRRYIAAYMRLRRMRSGQDLKNWREAAERTVKK